MQRDFRHIVERLGEVADESPSGRAGTHLRTVQAQIDAIARGDFEAILATAAADVSLTIFAPDEFEWVRRATGVDELRRAIRQNFESVIEQRPELTDVFSDGDDVVLFGRERGRVRATGAPYELEFVERFTFREGRLAAVRVIAAYCRPETAEA